MIASIVRPSFFFIAIASTACAVMDSAVGQTATQYCSVIQGAQQCGFPTLESCLQSVSGAGGVCNPASGQVTRPDLLPSLLQGVEQRFQQNPPPPGGTWVPPPPNN